MRYTEAIQTGVRIINRNWQLVLIQVGAMLASFVGFFIVVGIPLAIAFIIFGLDLTELSRLDDVFRVFRGPSEVLSRYFALAILVLTSILLYLTAVMCLGVFFFGGAIGVISRSISDRAEKFQMRVFFSEGRRLFFPLIGFTSLVGLIFILVAFVLGLFGGLISAVVTIAKEQEATLALFLGIFFSLILFVIGLTLIVVTLAVTAYGSAIMAMRGEGPVRSLRDSVRYLLRHSQAFYFYCLVFLGYLFVIFMVVSVSYPIGLIPLVGSLLAFVYQFGVYIIQSYAGLVTIAALFCYYYSTSQTAGAGEQGPGQAVSPAEGSAEGSDTSVTQAHAQDAIPPEKDPGEGD